jgi:hypothetical protein
VLKAALKWPKWAAIILLSVLTGSSFVKFFGSTYAVYGNVVQKVSK